MKYVIDILEELNSTRSRNEKTAILKKYANHPELKMVVKAALDPMTQYYIRKIPEYEKSPRPIFTLSQALKNLQPLTERSITGNKAIEHLRYQLEMLEEKDALVLERVIQKDLKCGVSVKTVNAVWPNFIQEYPVMLCERMDEKTLQKISWPAICQVKYDGMRANLFLDFGRKKVQVNSRNGKFIEIGDLFDPILKCFRVGHVVLDGEFLVADNDGRFLPRKEGNGIINKAIKGTISPEELQKIHFVVWDIIPYDKFVTGKHDVPYSKRLEVLQNFVEEAAKHSSRIVLAETIEADSFYEAHKWYLKQIEKGNEGIIIKDKRSPWESKRSPYNIKMKVENEADLVIVGVQEGTGKYQGKLGSFLLEDASGCLSVSVGSGFSDEQRDIYFSDSMIGKIVTVKYNEVITNQAGEKSLFLPIFVEVRDDKTEADRLEDLQK